MVTDKATILASVVANGLRPSGRNKWTDGRCEWMMHKRDNGYELSCRWLVPVRNWNDEIRACLRPQFMAYRRAHAT